jgi:crotonobetainyl-CoA:carnitine CoA-transferase CaiB-like acyl-CoA transferase
MNHDAIVPDQLTAMSDTRRGPLDDLTIIDCSMAYAGPFGTALLADLGANVIKVEPPTGDTFRALPPFPPDYGHAAHGTEAGADYGMAFAGVNRNKRSVCLDLKNPDDAEILLQMCERADALVENMRAGVMDELGLGYEVVAERNPQIVYAVVRGFGDDRTGASPYGSWPCLDTAGQAMGGLVEATGGLYEIAIADIYPGTLMALGLVSAVHRAQHSGRGDFVDVAMYDSALTMLRSHVPAYSLTQRERRPGQRVLVPFGLFPTTDGHFAIAAPVERHWQLLCQAMERPDLITDERTSTNPKRAANREFTEGEIRAWTSTRSKQQLQDLLGGKVPCGPANSLGEIFDDPHVAGRQMLEECPLPGDNPTVALAANPIKLAANPTGLYQRPPTLGEHTDEVLTELGIARRPR